MAKNVINNVVINAGGNVVIGDNNSFGTTSAPPRKDLRSLVGLNKQDEVLNELQVICAKNGSGLSTVILLKAEYSDLKRNELMGVLSYQEVSLKRNQLNARLLDFISSLDLEEETIISLPQQPLAEMDLLQQIRLFLYNNKNNLLNPVTKVSDLIRLNKLAISQATLIFPKGTADYIEYCQPWQNDIDASEFKREWKDSLVKHLQEYLNSMEEGTEELTKRTPLEELLYEAKESKDINTLIKFIELKQTTIMPDKAKQLADSWKLQLADYNRLTGAMAKAIRIETLKKQFLFI